MNVEEKVLSLIDEQEAVELAKKLIQFDTGNPPGNVLKCAEFLHSVLQDMGLETEVQILESPHANVVGRTTPHREGRTLLLEAHMDQAPLAEWEKPLWRVDPFAGIVENGRIFGKGIVDMKGGIVTILTALKAVLRSGIDLKGNVKVAFFADEEGFMRGVKHFIKSGGADHVNGCISTEPIPTLTTITGSRTWGKITVIGRSTSSGVDPTFALESGLGINAIHQASKFLQEISRRKPSCAPNEIYGESWWHILKISGGWDPENAPMVPETCEMTLEGRLVPGHRIDDFWKEVEAIIAKLKKEDPNFEATIDVIERRPGYSFSESDPLVQTLSGAYKQVMGKAPSINPKMYPWNSTNDTHYIATKGVPCVVFGPIDPVDIQAVQKKEEDLDNFSANESLSIDSIMDVAKIMALTIIKYTG